VGWPADVTVFDPDRIRDLVSDRLPQKVDAQEVNRHPAGVGAVIVNGQVAVQDGECMDVYAGRSRRADLSPSVPEQGAGR
jgi:N-acyl-D-aspartate/D-glutamate deacylase